MSQKHQHLTLDDAALLFQAAKLPHSTRTLYRWFTTEHAAVCPLIKTPDREGDEVYHYRRVRAGDVEKLINKLLAAKPAK